MLMLCSMDQSTVSSSFEIGRHMESARTALGSLRRLADESPTVPRVDVMAGVETTLSELALVGQLLRAGSDEPQRIACSSCGGMIMPAATLCMHCWRKRTP